jgi:hypothetical protein
MKILELSYSEGKTIQEKQFEPRSFHFSIKAEVVEGEDLKKAYKELKDVVKRELGEETSKYLISQKAYQAEERAF